MGFLFSDFGYSDDVQLCDDRRKQVSEPVQTVYEYRYSYLLKRRILQPKMYKHHNIDQNLATKMNTDDRAH